MKFDAILFDCDGVLVDSEPIVGAVLRNMLAERGWVMTLEMCMQTFVGKAVRDEHVMIEAHTGQALTPEWLQSFYDRRNLALTQQLEIVAGAHVAVQAAHDHTGQRIACASGADRFKVEMQLTQVGLIPFFAGHIFSGHEMPHSKPAPDVYLAAAQHLAVPASRCLVVEDSVVGATAGVAAGATVWAYCPDPAQGEALLAVGVSRLFGHMGDLPALLAIR